MRTWLAPFAACLLAAPSVEAPPPPKWSDEIPPRRFRTLGLVPVLFVPETEIAQHCAPVGQVPKGLVIVACTLIDRSGQPLIIMPDPCPDAERGDPYARVICHELAHAGGWRHETE